MNIIILGPPGSGKTTQAQLLAAHLGAPHLNAGDLLHLAEQAKTATAHQIRGRIEKGVLVDDALVVQLLEEHLRQKEHTKGTVIDGFPRSLVQARLFNFPIDKVFHIEVSDETIRKRLLARGRTDDALAAIEKRIEIYHQEIEPILSFYKERGLLTEVAGEGEVETTFEEIKKNLQI